MFTDAMAKLDGESKEEVKETVEDQSKEEVKEETKTEEVAEEKEVSQPETTTEAKTEEVVETKQPETKPPYTPEEIKELAATGDFSKFDSSRLTPGEQAAVRSMQAGLTPKLQRAAELEKNFQALIEKTKAEEQRRAQEESERKYREEKDQYGDEEATRMKEMREIRAEMAAIKQQQAGRDAELQREQNQVAVERFRIAFKEKAPAYGIPVTDEWSEEVQSRVLAENYLRSQNGEPYITIDDAMQKISKTRGLSDLGSLEKLLDANPKLKEALENKFKDKYNTKKKAGPTTVKSSSGGSGNPDVNVKSAKEKLLETDSGDMGEDMERLAMLYLEETEKK